MSQDLKTVRAYVIPQSINQRFTFAMDYANPEEVLAKKLREFAETIGFSQLFPNFKSLRVGTIHPFIIMLAQEVLGTEKVQNIFPSITIADTTLNESTETAGDEFSQVPYSRADVVRMGGFRETGEVFISDDGYNELLQATEGDNKIVGVERLYRVTSTMDFNIWADNKEVTSFLFDMVLQFLSHETINLHNMGYDLGVMSGSRSGDVNMDFGMLLYGANVRIPLTVARLGVTFDVYPEVISEINVKTLPTFHEP